MAKIWKSATEIKFDGKIYSKSFLGPQKTGRIGGTPKDEEALFYIPAQRILSVSDGRPKPFMEFDTSAPYVLRQFSETLRQLLQNGMGKLESIFPVSNRLKKPLRNSFNQSIFQDGKIIMDERTGQKKLRMEVDGMSVPFITWSAGQKEFMPLLLGFYWLCPPSKISRKDNLKYVVIEEPEMGLHPQAIKSVILQIIDLLSRDYKVIVSTHSPVLLEFAWAFNILKKSGVSDDALFELFEIPKTTATKRLFKGIISEKVINTHCCPGKIFLIRRNPLSARVLAPLLGRGGGVRSNVDKQDFKSISRTTVINTYYFDRENDKVTTKDISTLDAGSDDGAISEWGGLSSFAGKATDIVSKYFIDEE